ncbi:MAG: 5-(carboxyamino)imidazole ribonucleotide synthase [Chitinophagaceae bacterium]|nr:5-(carboxyamino)imidazole ribonucleotide synthase [Chitinophagaceae bacterium]
MLDNLIYFALMIYNTRQEAYYVYIILCGDGSYYTGLTDDLLRRFEEHLKGVYEDCYTAIRQPLELKYYETIPFLQDAVDREIQLKGWSKAKKQALIEGNFHKLQLLAECQNLSHTKYKSINATASVFDFAQTGQENPSTPLRATKNTMKKIGILGGGQLGRMLLQAAANYPVETFVMENDDDCPAAHLCDHFTKGNISSYDDVYHFGKGLDAITIEIESVNADALEQLEKEGVKVYPKPSALKTIKNKILQKQFYKDHQIPSSDFIITKNIAELKEQAGFLPAVHKLGEGGYDGRGVQLIKTANEMALGFDAPAVLEKMVPIAKEIALIVAVNDNGESTLYPPVDMVFDPHLNLLSYQISPAELPDKTLWRMEAIAIAVVKALQSPGIFAVELFVDKVGEVYVNETAPRVHNSGHHTIEANYSSQFDMLWRIMLGYPLGNTEHILPAAIVNVLGADGHSGPAYYEGLEEILKIPNVFVHVYGKKQTKPGRKMGHITIISKEKQELIHQVNRIKQTLKVITK